MLLTIVLAACGGQQEPSVQEVTRVVTETIEVEGEPVEVTRVVEETVVEEVVVTATPGPKFVEEDWPDMTWDEVVEEANGQSVNWYFWGGNDNINTYVAEYIGGRLQEEYGITLNSVHVNDTVEAVNKVLGEAEAGRTEDGTVDLIWINGENFKTLRQADLLFGPYAEELPNVQQYIDMEGPYFTHDFGHPIQGYESPWGASQFVMIYDSAVVSEPPTTVPELTEWICENPGQLAYPAPPDFTGTAFLTHFFYEYTGGHEQWQGRFDDEMQALFDEKAPAVWEVLNEIEPCLWRGGQTYANSPTELDELFGNSETAMNMNYGVTHASIQVSEGLFPETTRTFVFDSGTVANAHYVAIPFNSPNKAAALVTANLILSPEAQLQQNDPEAWGWGSLTALDLSKVPDDVREQFDNLELGAATLPLSEVEPDLPPLSSDLLPLFEAGWRENVLQQ
jgi:putative spermidine/putrescine transport system substrate-binding protein